MRLAPFCSYTPSMKEPTVNDNAGVIAIPPLLYGGALVVTLVAHHFYPIRYMPDVLSAWLGALLIALSVPLVLSVVARMRRARTAIDVRKPTTAIVTQGAFRFSRNPAYLSLTLLYVGISSLVNSAWILAGILPVLFLMQRGVIEREERYLEKKFGEQYLVYKKRVRRWI